MTQVPYHRDSSDLTDGQQFSGRNPLPLMTMTSIPPFSARDAMAMLGLVMQVLGRALPFRRRSRRTPAAPPPPGLQRATSANWSVGLLHVAGLVLILPVVLASRLLPGHWQKRHEESVFVETNRTVLTALGFAFMA